MKLVFSSLILFLGCILFPVQAFTIKLTDSVGRYIFYKTQGWLESDHSGSGYHLNDDFVKPNIWIRVFRYDSAKSDVAGLPNNETAGRHVKWEDTLTGESPVMRGGDYYKILRKVDFDPSKLGFMDASGNCSGQRCYGDWLNDDLVWDHDKKPYKGIDDQPFLLLDDDLAGQKRTRYRVDIYVEDNTPFWWKDKNGKYDRTLVPPIVANTNGTHTKEAVEDHLANNMLYYPFKRVVFRIMPREQFESLSDPDSIGSETEWDSFFDAQDEAEYYIKKEGEDLNLKNFDPEFRRKNGRMVLHFAAFHSFQKESAYVLQVAAEDMGLNRRVLNVPINMGRLKGLQIHDRSSGSQSTN